MNLRHFLLSASVVTLLAAAGACSAGDTQGVPSPGATAGTTSSAGMTSSAGSSATPGASGTAPSTGGSGGSSAMPGGGAGTGGSMTPSGGMTGAAGSAGGHAGTSAGGASGGTGGSNMSGAGGGAAGAAMGGAGGVSGGTCTLGSCPPGNAPIPSSGCSKPLGMLKTGSFTISSGGAMRKYAVDVPANYDPNHPYRLFFTWHWIGASQDVLVNGVVESINGTGVNGGPDKYAFYGLKREAEMANQPAIFIAPSSNGSQWDFSKDGPLFEQLLELASSQLCIDTSRVFSTGFSFGAMMSYALSITHQKQLRAVVGMAAANYNLPAEPTDNKQPIAYMGTTGMSDGTCPYIMSDADKKGGKYCALAHAEDNGCTIADIPTVAKGSKTHMCYDFVGCKAGYPTRMCTFDGTHQCNVADGGTTNDGLKSWIPDESWKFFSQF